MRLRLTADLTELREASLDERRQMHPRPPVPVLDALPQGRAAAAEA
jgi:hypothetical protein